MSITIRFFMSLFLICLSNEPGDLTLISREGEENAYPRLSKDGRTLLYQSNRYKRWQLFIADLNERGEFTGQEKLVGPGSCNNNFPDLSPDNQWVAFVSDQFDNEEICVMRINGTDLKRLTQNTSRDIHPYFSPDGKKLLFNSDRSNGSLDIFEMDLTSGITRQITNGASDETCGRYSPDMKKIVFLQNSATSDDVFEMDVATGKTHNVTGNPAVRDGWPVYGPDGRWIYYSSMEEGPFCIYRIKPDGSAKEKLTAAKKGEEHARVFVTADNSGFVYNVKWGRTIAIVKKSF